jgi:hypothetical protein
MIGQLLPNTNEMLQCILAIQILDLNTAEVVLDLKQFKNFLAKRTLHETLLDSRQFFLKKIPFP